MSGGIGIVEMLYNTSLVALVGIGDQPWMSPRSLKLINTKTKKLVCQLTFPTAVLKVKMNRQRLVVVLEEQIYIYDTHTMELLQTVETWPNLQGVCALAENSYLAYPTAPPKKAGVSNSGGGGDVVVYDTVNLQPINVIAAHKRQLSVVAFDSTGRLLATASDKGTIVRVFRVASATKAFEFRRGTYPTQIYSINFNVDSSLLVVSTTTETVHVFKLDRPVDQTGSPGAASSPSGVAGGSARKNGGFLSAVVAQFWEPQRDFAYIKISGVNRSSKSVAAFNETSSRVFVITGEGSLYQFSLDCERGGECELIQQYSLGST